MENENRIPGQEPAASEAVTEETAEAKPVKVSSKHIRKAERREAKAARKAANQVKEKESRPNNALIAILIFGVVIAMFAFVLGYNYFSKPATIEKYIEENGGADTYGSMQLDAYTTAAVTAEGNTLKIEMTVDTGDDEESASQAREFYTGDDGKKQLDQLAAYFLTDMKPLTRAFSADVKASVRLGDEELASTEMTYKEAEKLLKEAEEEAEEDQDSSADDAAEDAAEAAEDAAEAAEDAAEAAAEGSGEASE